MIYRKTKVTNGRYGSKLLQFAVRETSPKITLKIPNNSPTEQRITKQVDYSHKAVQFGRTMSAGRLDTFTAIALLVPDSINSSSDSVTRGHRYGIRRS